MFILVFTSMNLIEFLNGHGVQGQKYKIGTAFDIFNHCCPIKNIQLSLKPSIIMFIKVLE